MPYFNLGNGEKHSTLPIVESGILDKFHTLALQSENELGKLLRRLRLQNNQTQADWALLLNVSGHTVYRWEAGKSIPRASKLYAICLMLADKRKLIERTGG